MTAADLTADFQFLPLPAIDSLALLKLHLTAIILGCSCCQNCHCIGFRPFPVEKLQTLTADLTVEIKLQEQAKDSGHQ